MSRCVGGWNPKMVVCPSCDGSGGGNGGRRGPLGDRLESVCRDCCGEGEVLPSKRDRLLLAIASKEA